MNFYNNFVKSWSDKFPNIPEPEDLKCLKADGFFSVNDQKNAVETLSYYVSLQIVDIKAKHDQLLYFNDFLKSSVIKLNTIAQMFDNGNGGNSVSNCQSDETIPNNITFLSHTTTSNTVVEDGTSNMFLTSFDSNSTDINWKSFPFASLPCTQHDRASNNFSFLNGDIKLENQLSEMKQFSTAFITPSIKNDIESSKFLSSHHSESIRRQFKCDQCERSFTQKSGLEAHIKLHTGERPYECQICGRAFKLKAQLQTHERVHSGERPFGCKICGKLFRQQCHVVQHLRSHTDEKPHQCKKCGKGFRQKHSLLSHEKRQCQTRQSRRMLPAGTTMWIGLSDVPGGSLTKELLPSSENPMLTVTVIPTIQNNDSTLSQSCSTGAEDSSSIVSHDD